jgi:hypothetical protein
MVRNLLSRRTLVAAVAATLAYSATGTTRAGVVTYRLGQQDFAHGQGPLLVSQSRAAGSDEAFPFDGTVFGDDRTRRFGRIRFTYSFAPVTTPAAGTLTLGLLGLDSPPGSEPTVRLYLDGVEQPNAAFAGVSSAVYRSSASVVTVPVPAELLADGQLNVSLRAYRASPGYPGNAIAADFSTLQLSTSISGGDNSGGSDGGDGGTDGGTDGENNGGGNNGGGNNGGGIDGGGNPTPNPIPLPPAAWAGLSGLVLAALLRKKVA